GALVWLVCAAASPVLGPRWCWRFSRRAARAFAWLAGLQFTVRGLEHVPRDRACLLAVNHASYLDGIMMVAALPQQMVFVAKRELLDHWVPRTYLRSIGAAFVDRQDAQRGVEEARQFAEAARGGQSLIVFPEGTFRRMPGLLPFRMGA